MAGLNNKAVNTFIVAIVTVIVLFAAYTAIYPTAAEAGDAMNDSNQCSDASCFYNASRSIACTANNVTAGDTASCTTANSIPLSGLFSGTGVLFIIIAAALMIGIVLGFIRKKN